MKTTTMLRLGALACFFATGALGCATTDVQVHAASLPSASFSQYRTFSFGVPEAAPDGYEPNPRSAEVKRRMQPLIAAALEQKGYVLVDNQKGDMIIKFATGARERVIERNARVANAMGEVEDDDFIEGGLVVDVFDGQSQGQVFHGSAKARIETANIDEQRLGRVVREVLAKFPVEHAAPSSALNGEAFP